MGYCTFSGPYSALAIPSRRSTDLLSQHRASRHGARRCLALDTAVENKPEPTDRRYFAGAFGGREPGILARSSMAASGVDERGVRGRYRLLVQCFGLFCFAGAQGYLECSFTSY